MSEDGKPTVVAEIVKDYLEAHGYDGLCREECGCRVDHLFPCCGDGTDVCKPGYLHRLPCNDCGEKCDDEGADAVVCAVPSKSNDAPEPKTSVIRWTRYDGIPETLPKTRTPVILRRQSDRQFAPLDMQISWLKSGRRHKALQWYVLDRKPRNPEVGDEWACLQGLPDYLKGDSHGP